MFTFGALARNTLWMIAGQGVRILVQLVYFILIARLLHKDGYGAFAGAVALVAVLAPFAGWGSGNLLVKNVARAPGSFPVYWGRALGVTALSASFLTLLALVLAWLILPSSVSLRIVLWVALSDLFFTRLSETCCLAFQAVHDLFKTAALSVLYALAKLAAVVVLWRVAAADTLATWSLLYLFSSAAVGLIGTLWVSFKLGMPRWDFSGWRREFPEGFYFAAGLSAQRIYMDSDKALLTRLGSLEAAGIYTAAARVVEVAFIPVYSLLAAAYARFFTHGAAGLRGTVNLSRGLLPYALAYAAAAGIGLYVFAPVLPWLLGREFSESVAAIRWLSSVPLLMTLHRFAADSLTGAGWQATRTRIEFGAAAMNVLLNLLIVPLYSWRGTAWITLFTELALVAMLALAVRSRLRHPHAGRVERGVHDV